MSQDSQVNFDSLRSAGSATQGRGEPSFEPRDRALDLHALAVLALRKAAVHLAAIFGLRPATSAATLVQVDDRAADAQRLARIRMIVLGIVTGVGQHTVEVHALAGAAQHRCQQRRIVRRPVVHQRVNQQVRRVVTGQRQLGPATNSVAFLPDPVGVMRRAVPGLHTRGIDAGLLFSADEFPPDRVGKDRVEQSMEQTFFKRRCCAL
jgi:hypothetical protein